MAACAGNGPTATPMPMATPTPAPEFAPTPSPTLAPPPSPLLPLTTAPSRSYYNGRVACSERIVGGSESAIFTYASDGSDRRILTTSGYNIMPSWSWDGRRILFSSNLGGAAAEIWVMDADGGNKRQLTSGTQGGNFTPVESPDGTQIGFSSLRRSVGHPEVWVIDADGTNQQRLTTTVVIPGQGDVWSLHPSWSPDGERIVYASTSSGLNSDPDNECGWLRPTAAYRWVRPQLPRRECSQLVLGWFTNRVLVRFREEVRRGVDNESGRLGPTSCDIDARPAEQRRSSLVAKRDHDHLRHRSRRQSGDVHCA